MRLRLALLAAAGLTGGLATPALALADATTASVASAASTPPASSDNAVSEVVVTARRLDAARQTVEPALGASTYSLPEQLVNNLPGGQNVQFNQVILQAPGAAQDSFGQLHIRGDHNNIQYRLDNVILPEGLSVFGQTLSPRLASNIDLITGALPAQYGLRTAGVINITTKSGIENGGEMSIYGGSHDMYEPSAEYGGTWGANSAFVSGSFTHTALGVESPDGSSTPLHDVSNQLQAFGYFDHIIDSSSRISLILGTSQETFQIPNSPGLHPDLGYSVNGQTDFLSDDLNERQREGSTFAIVSYQRSVDKATIQASAFARYSSLTFDPDPIGDILFNGMAQTARKTDAAAGVQIEGVYDLTDAHTIRSGVIIEGDHAVSNTSSNVLPVDPLTGVVGQAPITIADDGAKTAWTYSAYVQDEWKLLTDLTLNYGLRFDQLESYRSEHQFSPRVNLVWTPWTGATLHAGYARYFSPPPFELVANETVAKFANTTAAPPTTGDTTPYSMRTNYFDVGAQQKLGSLTLGVDAYYRDDRNLIDEGQFGAPIILTPFNYAKGYARGVEFTANYVHGPFSVYGNLAISKAQGQDIDSSQFNFTPEELAYIAGHYIYLDHNQTITGSAGASYRLGDTHLNADVIIGSGLRSDGAVPNGDHVPAYAQVNFSVVHDFHTAATGAFSVRLDLINAFDKVYEIRDGTGVGVGAPQFGPRRGLFAGVTKSF